MISISTAVGAPAAPSRSNVMREIVPRADRVPRDERVDVPEVQESTRVNFSDAARAAASGRTRDAVQSPTYTEARGGIDPRVQSYRDVARL